MKIGDKVKISSAMKKYFGNNTRFHIIALTDDSVVVRGEDGNTYNIDIINFSKFCMVLPPDKNIKFNRANSIQKKDTVNEIKTQTEVKLKITPKSTYSIEENNNSSPFDPFAGL